MATPKDYGYDTSKLTPEQLESVQQAIDAGNVFSDRDQDPPADSVATSTD